MEHFYIINHFHYYQHVLINIEILWSVDGGDPKAKPPSFFVLKEVGPLHTFDQVGMRHDHWIQVIVSIIEP